MNMINPFEKYEAEDYDVESVYEMFVDDKTIINEFTKPRHHFIWGSRGSGKSMLLRYFEPYCQFKVFGGWEQHFTNENSFIGIYCPIPRGLLSDNKFKKIDETIAEILSSHLFNMLVAENIMKTICEQLKEVKIDKENMIRFVENFIEIIVAQSNHIAQADRCHSRSDESLLWVYEFIKQEKLRIVKYVQFYPFTKQDYDGCLTDYHDFIDPFIKIVKELLNFKNSIYIMFDDAGFLSESIQKRINTWISNRNHNEINIKVACEQLHYKSFLTIDGQIIEKVNDFEDIYLDWREITENRKFESNIYIISQKRLALFNMGTTDIRILFPEDIEQNKLLNLAKDEAIKELKAKNNQIEDIDRYINRVSIHILHKKLGDKRTPRNYAGYNYIINLAFGNIRSFLRLAKAIIEVAIAEIGVEGIRRTDFFVEPSIQNKAITDFSKKEFQDIKNYKPGEQQSTLEGLHIMINSLCEYFKYRLKNMALTESGVTAFALKNFDELDENVKNIIRVAIRYRYLIRKSYKKKNGLGREEIYALNKLLIPAFGLESLPFSGRVVLSKVEFEICCSDSNKFLQTLKNKTVNVSKQLTLFDYSVADMNEDLEDYDEYCENNLSNLY